MKYQPYKTAFILLLLLAALGSCTERIDIELDETYTRLVVEGYLTTDTTRHTVKLSKTADYFANEPVPPVRNAKVTINDSITLSEVPDKPGLYQTAPDIYGVPGTTYTLKIEGIDINSDGTQETYKATSEMKSIGTADSIDIAYQEFAEEARFWQVLAYAQDPEERNYYIFKVAKNDTLLSDTLSEWMVQADDFFNGNYIAGVPVQFLDVNKKQEVVRKNDTITLEINSITDAYHSYFHELLAETRPSTPLFSGPPANMTTNVEASEGLDPVGFFAAYSIERVSMVVKNPEKKKEASQ